MKAGIIALAAMAALVTAGPVAAADGKAVFEKNSCAGCHKVMAPKLGDKAAWAPRIKQGADALTAAVIKGMGPMPPRGGTKLSDADIKAAVEYIISQAK
jgi:cytochrome c5